MSTPMNLNYSMFLKLPYVVQQVSNVPETILIALPFLYPVSINKPTGGESESTLLLKNL